jgi:23S rRNA (uracil1939-C5)-methyltransferase
MESTEYIKEPGAGFHIPGMFDKVLDIDYCWHQPDPSNQIRLALKEYVLKHNLDFFNLKTKQGFIRNLIVRNTSTGEWMIIVSFGKDDKESINNVLSFLSEQFPMISSLLYVVNEKLNDTINDLEIKTFKGKDFMIEKMEDLSFKIGPKSFFQTNTKQAYNLYNITRKMAGLTGKETVYDLYTGTGTIANFVAKNSKYVIGIESINEAIEAAKENSSYNGIANTKFFCGDIKEILTTDFINQHGKPDVIITDPPRAGMHNSVIESILYADPAKIVYVSCNSATQARDLNLLSSKFEICEIQPVDMFPHTYHVENVALLLNREHL